MSGRKCKIESCSTIIHHHDLCAFHAAEETKYQDLVKISSMTILFSLILVPTGFMAWLKLAGQNISWFLVFSPVLFVVGFYALYFTAIALLVLWILWDNRK